MPIDRKLIRRLERLSRIELSEDEREDLTADLEQIIRFVETVQSVDTTGAAASPLAEHLDEEHVRDDEPVPGLNRDSAVGQSAGSGDGFFRVPPVIDRGHGE